ncbi:MAG: hypothetical protein OHK0039_12430 [Bacteroidia bacterium]
MKRLFYLTVIIVLPILAFFQFDKYRRFHPPSEYSYAPHKGIDLQYHDPEVLLRYYQLATEADTYARHIWYEH